MGPGHLAFGEVINHFAVLEIAAKPLERFKQRTERIGLACSKAPSCQCVGTDSLLVSQVGSLILFVLLSILRGMAGRPGLCSCSGFQLGLALLLPGRVSQERLQERRGQAEGEARSSSPSLSLPGSQNPLFRCCMILGFSYYTGFRSLEASSHPFVPAALKAFPHDPIHLLSHRYESNFLYKSPSI